MNQIVNKYFSIFKVELYMSILQFTTFLLEIWQIDGIFRASFCHGFWYGSSALGAWEIFKTNPITTFLIRAIHISNFLLLCFRVIQMIWIVNYVGTWKCFFYNLHFVVLWRVKIKIISVNFLWIYSANLTPLKLNLFFQFRKRNWYMYVY